MKMKMPALIRKPLERYAWRALRSSGAIDDLQQTLMKAFRRSLATDHPATIEQMRSNQSWLFAANRQIGGRGARVPMQLQLNARTDLGKVKGSRVFDHPFLDLLQQPNGDESGMVYHWRQLLQLNTIGRVYVLVRPEMVDLSPLGIKLVASRIRSMHLMPPHRTSPLRVGTNDQRIVSGYEVANEVSGQPDRFMAAPHDRATRQAWKSEPYPFIFTIVMPAPDSMFGQSVSEAAGSALKVTLGLNKLHENQLLNGLHSGLIFWLLREMDEPERFEKAVLTVKMGLGKAGEPLILPRKMVEVDKNPLTNKDMEFPGLSTLARREILSVAGSSEGMVGLVEDVNRSNIEGLERMIAIGTVDPLNALISDAYNTWLLPLYRGQSDRSWYSCMFPSSATGDDLTVAETLKELTGGKPVLTQNEGRDRLGGLEPKPGGDSIAQSGSVSNVTDTDEPPRARTQPRVDEEVEVDVELPTEAGANLFYLLADDHPLATPEGRELRWRDLDVTRRTTEMEFRRDLAKVFRDWRDEFVALVEKEGPGVLETRQDALDVEEWKRRFVAAHGPAATQAMIEAANNAFGDLGVALALAPDDFSVEQFVERHGTEFASFVVATQMDVMRDSLQDSVDDELSAVLAALAVKETFPSANAGRTRTMAATVIGAAIGAGTFEASRRVGNSGKRVGLMWLSARDKSVRDTHRTADGQIVEVGQAFAVGDCLMRFPLDSELCSDAGEIVNCRCRPEPMEL